MIERRHFLTLTAAAGAGLLRPSIADAADRKVLMMLFRSTTPSETAFAARLAELKHNVDFTVMDTAQDLRRLDRFLIDLEPRLEKGEFDAIYSYGTTVTAATKRQVRGRVPIIFNIVYDPLGAKLVDSLTTPGGRMTGVTNGVALEDQMTAFNTLAPMKRLLILFNSREQNANIHERRVTDWAQARGIAVTSRRVAPGTPHLNEVLDEVKQGRLDVDSLFAGAEVYLATEAATIQLAIGNRVRLFGGTQTFVIAGWLAAYAPEVAEMGRVAADQMAGVFAGEDAGKMPIILPPPKLFLSQAAAARYGIALPVDAVIQS